MPKIAPQHSWKDADHTPLDSWPDDCLVQWGGRGIVLGFGDKSTYQTAFFEAFPHGGCFIRGEGKTIVDAEAKAFEQFQKEISCTHQWSRGARVISKPGERKRWQTHYTNGGAICKRCNAFAVKFRPIVELGNARRPLSIMEIDSVANGFSRPCPEDKEDHKHKRRRWLRARYMGIDLPDFDSAPANDSFDEDDYSRACAQAVATFIKDNPDFLKDVESMELMGLKRLFDRLHTLSLKRTIGIDT